MSKIPNRTDQDVRQLASDLLNGKLFTDRHLKSPEQVRMVFLPIALGAFNEWTEEEFEQIGMIYEHMHEAGPVAVNGKPSFFSVKLLNIHDTELLFKYYNELKTAQEQFLNGGTNENSTSTKNII